MQSWAVGATVGFPGAVGPVCGCGMRQSRHCSCKPPHGTMQQPCSSPHLGAVGHALRPVECGVLVAAVNQACGAAANLQGRRNGDGVVSEF